jgi:hypothetical protein
MFTQSQAKTLGNSRLGRSLRRNRRKSEMHVKGEISQANRLQWTANL